MKNKITHVTWTERVWPERGLNGAALKWIAMCSMFIDHIGAVILEYGLYYQGGAERMDSGTVMGSIFISAVAVSEDSRPPGLFDLLFSSCGRLCTYKGQKEIRQKPSSVWSDIGDPV